MTDDERLINELWPLIRETVDAYRPFMEQTGYLRVLQRRTLRQQMDFWLSLKRASEHPMPELTEFAREAAKKRRLTVE